MIDNTLLFTIKHISNIRQIILPNSLARGTMGRLTSYDSSLPDNPCSGDKL